MANVYATSSLSAPAMENFGDFTYSNTDALNSELQTAYGGASNVARYTKYVVYSEGIYVGYKYYETRYEDAILGKGNASDAIGSSTGNAWNYADEVVYPFGYGLSYTTFTQTLDKVETINDGKSFEVTVTVKNTGSVAGKSVVEIYGQSEYTEFDKTNDIEKSAVNLVGFEKTKELTAGESQTVKVTVNKYDLAVYDSNVNKGYIFEEGDYYLSLGFDSHDALNNILAAKGKTNLVDSFGNSVIGDANKTYLWKQDSTDTEMFKYSETTKSRVTNQFDDVDLNYYGNNLVTYLSRSDWKNTYPEPLQLTANQQMIEGLKFTYRKSTNTDTSAFKQEQDNGMTLAMMIGADYEDSYWDTLIDQMSIDDMLTAVARACKIEIKSIGKPLNYLQDTPTGFNKNSYYVNYAGYTFADVDEMTEYKPPQYPTEPVTAGTFNKELLQELGDAFGEDGLWLNVHHHYAPGANLHRTPYSGRNFEYYSEDAFLSSEMVAYQVRGARIKGLITYVKHFVANDQEMNRTGVSTFMTEQTFREVYLRGFEGCFTKFYEEGNSTNALMGGFNRIGVVWDGAHKGLMTNLLTDEWGFLGMSDTDMAAWTHMEAKSGVMAGTTDFAITNDSRANEILTDLETDADLYAALREAVKRNLYVIANSQEMNGISSTMKLVPIATWYQILLTVLDIIFGVLLVGCATMLVLKTRKEDKE
ncbi:MAG: fibronectin type III-like domain-contianing protein [Clostridia bacterium]|nr:fibronectin type III-like domain-contianing protein [Clostridia bacterium]